MASVMGQETLTDEGPTHMSHRVSSLRALKILDSRARQTLEVTVTLESRGSGTFGVPAGAWTGGAEAVELRDHDPNRYGGQGVRKAVAAVQREIAESLLGRSFDSLDAVDRLLIDLDGTEDQHRLGANAIVGVSVAMAKAMAAADEKPLWPWLAADRFVPSLPVPFFNLVNGGAHARNRLAFQEFMVAPMAADSFAEALRTGVAIYVSLRAQLQERGLEVGLGDEGGFAPEADSFIADLTVGTGSGQLKSGAPARGELVARYNRLLRIEAETVRTARSSLFTSPANCHGPSSERKRRPSGDQPR